MQIGVAAREVVEDQRSLAQEQTLPDRVRGAARRQYLQSPGGL